jgi:hypothetical protein
MKKFLTWEEKIDLMEEIKEYCFEGNSLNVLLKEQIKAILISVRYGDFSDFVIDRLAEDNESGYIDIMNIGKTYNKLITEGLYSKIAKYIDKYEYDSIVKLIDEYIFEESRKINSLEHMMSKYNMEDIASSLEQLDYDKINRIKAITDNLEK